MEKWIFLVFSFSVVLCDLFSSTSHVASVFQTEWQLVKIMENYLQELDNQLASIKRYIEHYKAKSLSESIINQDMRTIIGNPLEVYNVLKRLSQDFKEIQSQMDRNVWQETLTKINEMKQQQIWPDHQDYDGAIKALVRLQNTYRLNIRQLANGVIGDMKTAASLEANDLILMGKEALHQKLYTNAVEWYRAALSKTLPSRENIDMFIKLEGFLNDIIEHHDQHHAEQSDFIHLFKDPLHTNMTQLFLPIQPIESYEEEDDMNYAKELYNFNVLCRGEDIMKNHHGKWNLKCFYQSNDPYYRLMPIKMEQHHRSPDVYTVFDVATDNEMKIITEIANQHLKRAHVVGRDGPVPANYRIAKTAFFSENYHPIFGKLARRIQWMTGLDTTENHSGEYLQVGNYGIGGLYEPHSDYFGVGTGNTPIDEDMKANGDRIATFMLYLSHVDVGGFTVFPRLGVAVKPVKGAAAFWWNLKRNVQIEPLTLHGGCPVLYGNKWVANKWIRSHSQMFSRPCLLDSSL